VFLFLLTLLLLPLRLARGFLLQWRSGKRPFKRLVIVGLDGLDPKIVEELSLQGRMPNLKVLAEEGSYSRLGTTLPALSPVAWSTFQTGVNPGSHNIFDFLTRDKRFCLPELSSTRTESVPRSFGLGKFRISFGARSVVKIARKGKPFWRILASHAIPSNVIRVPISYPPERFAGNILSAMCTPDLRGSQGTFTLYTTNPSTNSTVTVGEATSGRIVGLNRADGGFSATIEGPPDPKRRDSFVGLEFLLRPHSGSKALFVVGGEKVTLTPGEFSPWLSLSFPVGGLRKVRGIVRVCLHDISAEHASLYVSPVNIDPEHPALPISHPRIFSIWLAKLIGRFGTLGLLEDTWGRNEGALDDQGFLDQAYLVHEERERMFFETLRRTRDGLCVCVFDASDRIQHMFWRYIDPKHPSPREDEARFGRTVHEMYEKMDALVGRVRKQLNDDDLLVVLSDHGFSSFRRCFNVNTWLVQNGYMTLKPDAAGRDYLQDVDWSKTTAFGLGLTGVYINRRGRERQGIVSEDEANRLKDEISAKLAGVQDPADGSVAIRRVYRADRVYKGLYAEEAPDLIVGYAPGYRVSWESVTGMIEKEIFADNTKAWSGDHHVDPSEVPGVLFTNRKLGVSNPHISDIAPTALSLFGIEIPKYMEGKVLFRAVA
jgi:predicted AlkP superfamily phosphohydrolase/phosphomutase